jgi:hypothetical protein
VRRLRPADTAMTSLSAVHIDSPPRHPRSAPQSPAHHPARHSVQMVKCSSDAGSGLTGGPCEAACRRPQETKQ